MRNKLQKYKEINNRENVIDEAKSNYKTIKGNWNQFFGNSNPIILELACGYGEYSIGQARLFPDRNFIGIDVKGDRIWQGSTKVIEEELNNVAFLRAEIELLEDFFSKGEVSEIWVVFPDPRPKLYHAKKRLMSPRFIKLYKELLREGNNVVRLKTDNDDFFEYSLEIIKKRDDIENLTFTNDLYNSELRPECFDIKTRYERKFAALGEKINYLRFNFSK